MTPQELPRYSNKTSVKIEDGPGGYPAVHAQWGSYHAIAPLLDAKSIPLAMQSALECLARDVGQSLVFGK